MSRITLLAAVTAALAGCTGIIDPNITDFDLRVPERSFTMDTEQWDLSSTSGAVFPELACAADPSVCTTQIDALCGADQCAGACESGSCQMTVQVALWRMVDLYKENPELKTINEQPIVDVSIDRVHYAITENTLNIDTPALTLYMAPSNVMDARDPMAQVVGVIPPVPARSLQGKSDVMVAPEHEETLQAFMSDYQTSFNIIVSADLTVAAGDPMPMGRITADVGVDAWASAGI